MSRRYRRRLGTGIATLLWGACTLAVAPPRAESASVALATSDGKSLRGTWTRPPGVRGQTPAVLLLHEADGGDRSQWDPFVASLLREGWSTLALDLRGHGASDGQDGDYERMLSDPDQGPLDLRAAMAYLRDSPEVDSERIAVVGTSFGGNLACAGHALGLAPRLTVAVSAREDVVSALARTPAEALRLAGLLAVASRDDGGGYHATSARALVARSAAPRRAIIVPGGRHGRELLNQAGVWETILAFLRTHL